MNKALPVPGHVRGRGGEAGVPVGARFKVASDCSEVFVRHQVVGQSVPDNTRTGNIGLDQFL